MHTRLALALLLVSTSAAAAPPAKPSPAPSPFELTLEVVPAQPRPGERVYWLAKLRNASTRMLYVPTRTRDWLSFNAIHVKPEQGGAYGHGYGFGVQQPPLAWHPLAPGAVLEKGGALGDDVPECRHGCPVGEVRMTLEMAIPPKLGDEAPDADHIVPRGLHAEAGVTIRVPTYPLLERASADAVALSVLGARATPDGLRVRLSLENRTDAPLWLPRPAQWLATCAVTESAPGAWGTPGSRMGAEVRPLVLERAALVGPGRALSGEVACAGWQMPRRGTIAVTLLAPEWAEPRRAVRVPFVWTGMVESAVFEVGKSRGAPTAPTMDAGQARNPAENVQPVDSSLQRPPSELAPLPAFAHDVDLRIGSSSGRRSHRTGFVDLTSGSSGRRGWGRKSR